MKKLVSLLLAVCMCLSVGTLITACEAETGSGTEHSHTFKTEWETDPFYHWHVCDNRPCLEMSDRAEHIWDGGVMAVECDYTQTTFTPEGSVSATTWASWTFSDYGTTVIADAEE